MISLAIAGYFVGQYASGNLEALAADEVGLATTYVNRPPLVQLAFWIHIVSAGLALAVGPFQFAKPVRRRFPAVHRWIGRTYVASVAFASASGLVMAFYSSAALIGFFGFGSLAVLWGWTTYRGYRTIRSGDIAGHQAWMIRSFALTFAAPTLRLWLGTLIGVQLLAGRTDFEQIFDDAYAVVPFMCWLPNIVAAEFMIYRRKLPGLRFSPAPTSRPRVQARA
ncbi:DUF2306 domain-containing protein [Actinoplanes couchii]|uniref:DUF2306 domain-containing protein n=1 Tax=Actinoplanes couchii TaxID=403638 RepID=A0ABQ3X6Z1_9ACTN|nr:DUF2306 domain-containing protein [Actinoplanes couchii]MDR6322001.1 putative membrane protein [Actinoplanes couchii]GID54165.1 hypothetical protein Aco03nite_025690 [Actinoplanes couchii]